jgi:hypothetical protein
MYKVGDVIQHPAGGAKYRIVLIEEDQNAYKVLRLDNHQITLIGIDKGYVLTDPPKETFYQPGQVLLKREGPPRIGLVCRTIPGADRERHRYDVFIFTPQGELSIKYTALTEKEILKEFEISNFKWIVLYGDPRKIVRKALEKRAEKLQAELDEQWTLLSSLTYYDKILEEENLSNPPPLVDLGAE